MPTVLFTSESAKQYAKLSVAARKAKASLPHPASEPEQYQVRRLARVRAQLDRVDRMLMHETDPAKLDRLAAASMRLSDQEFALANRPKPAQARVTQTRLQSAKPKPVLLDPTADTTTPSVPSASPDPNSPK